MRALQYDAYGGIERLTLREVPTVQPSGGPLVKVQVAALNPKDALFRKGKFPLLSGRRFPKFCGLDFAGRVEVASGELKVGDAVFGMLQEFGFARGSLADYAAPKDDEVCRLPDGVKPEDGAAVTLVGLTALQALRDCAHLVPGMRVLLNGASGGVGTVGIQIAQALGAEVVTVSSEGTRTLCSQLGANEALDYTQLDAQLRSRAFDVVFDAFGNLRFSRARGALKPRGTFVSTVPTPARALKNVLLRFGAHQERLVVVSPNRRDLTQLGAWLKSGQLRAVLDGRFALADFAAAFKKLEGKHTHGKIIIDVNATDL
jgi:NADPH:quinone reductase-like Zn-dependent oxidoreductase